MSGWVNKFLGNFRDPHIEAAASVHRTNTVKQLMDQVASGRPPSKERVREVREMLDRDDALTNLFGSPPARKGPR